MCLLRWALWLELEEFLFLDKGPNIVPYNGTEALFPLPFSPLCLSVYFFFFLHVRNVGTC